MKTASTWNDQECGVSVIAGEVTLKGTLGLPAGARGIVLFAHGRGGSRHCPRNRYVAQVLRQMKLATLLLDLLTHAEEAPEQESQSWYPEIDLLAQRIVGATDWLCQNPLTQSLSIGYFGDNTGVGAALVAAAQCPETVSAIVARGGQLDLAGEAVAQVKAPTLLIVGGEDLSTIATNQEAMSQLKAEKRLEIVRGASHHFEEPGALEKVSRLASQWFESHLVSPQLSAIKAVR